LADWCVCCPLACLLASPRYSSATPFILFDSSFSLDNVVNSSVLFHDIIAPHIESILIGHTKVISESTDSVKVRLAIAYHWLDCANISLRLLFIALPEN
jgi:hypothetical protein